MKLQEQKGLRLCALGFMLLAFSFRLFGD